MPTEIFVTEPNKKENELCAILRRGEHVDLSSFGLIVVYSSDGYTRIISQNTEEGLKELNLRDGQFIRFGNETNNLTFRHIDKERTPRKKTVRNG